MRRTAVPPVLAFAVAAAVVVGVAAVRLVPPRLHQMTVQWGADRYSSAVMYYHGWAVDLHDYAQPWSWSQPAGEQVTIAVDTPDFNGAWCRVAVDGRLVAADHGRDRARCMVTVGGSYSPRPAGEPAEAAP